MKLTVQGVAFCALTEDGREVPCERTMASQSVRKSVGVLPDGFIKIVSNVTDNQIIRRVHRIPRELAGVGKDRIFMTPGDMRLMGLDNGDEVEVTLSDLELEVP